MALSRRNFLKFMGATGATVASLDRLQTVLAHMPATAFRPTSLQARSEAHYVIDRLTFGPNDALVKHVQIIGVEAFIEEQLNPEQLDVSNLRQFENLFPDINSNAAEILAKYENLAGQVYRQLAGNMIVRALYSPRQLYERMVHFWNDHFSIFASNGVLIALKIDDDRNVIREHALGKFRDLLGASAHSPAMLLYLDNALSEKGAPNENYARELLELHTLGIDGGYTELDVKEVARAFTGWSTTRPRQQRDDHRSEFRFYPFNHDDGDKTILGQLIASNGELEGEQILDIVARHPATANFVCTKLVRRFVSDNPPSEIVAACAETFLQTDGDIKSVLRTLFSHAQFWTAAPKFKRPIEYSVSVLRGLNYEMTEPDQFFNAMGFVLENLGHVPFRRSTPDGYPDEQADWQDNQLMRWNIAIASAHGDVPGASGSLLPILEANNIALEAESILLFMAELLYGRTVTEEERQILTDYVSTAPGETVEVLQDALALLVAAPAFQYR